MRSINQVTITVDRQKFDATPGLTFGRDILSLASLTPPQQLLLERDGDIDVPVVASDGILIGGGEVFVIGKGNPPIDDNPVLRHPVHITFNGEQVVKEKLFPRAKVTGGELKHLDPNLRAGDQLFADLKNLADEAIPDDLRLILQSKDRFISVPCGNVGYEDVVQRHLAEVQAVFPDATLQEQAGTTYLVVGGVPAPSHFSASLVSLLIPIPNGYPMSGLDMFWVDPHLRLADGREPQGASVYEQHLGRIWQRFSWHYTHDATAWSIGRSSLLTHIQFCQTRLALQQ